MSEFPALGEELKAVNLQQHPLSAAFPPMSELEFPDLVNDIRENGQRQPIVIFEGQVLDGWHRLRACRVVGIEPMLRELPLGEDPVAFVKSLNLERRHLNPSQRALVVVACNEWARSGQCKKGDPGAPLESNASMAATANVSERTIKRAKSALKAGLATEVLDGRLSVKEADARAKQAPDAHKVALYRTKERPKDRIIALEAALATKERVIQKLILMLREAGIDSVLLENAMHVAESESVA